MLSSTLKGRILSTEVFSVVNDTLLGHIGWFS
jgi:hypothetical protein